MEVLLDRSDMQTQDQLGAEREAVFDLGPLSAIPPGEGRRYVLDGVTIAVFRPRSGGVHATTATCPHRAGPLADGIVGGTTLICPLHGLRFDLVTGAAVGHDCGGIAVYPVEVDGRGHLRVQLTAREEHPG